MNAKDKAEANKILKALVGSRQVNPGMERLLILIGDLDKPEFNKMDKTAKNYKKPSDRILVVE